MTRKIVTILLALTMTACLLAGCGGDELGRAGSYDFAEYTQSAAQKRSIKVTAPQALLAMADAYELKGALIQYDQRWMDTRNKDLATRRSRWDNTSAPEAATTQLTKYTDCAKFQYANYYGAFGYELPAMVTDYLLDYPDLQVFYYEPSGQETEEETQQVLQAFQDTLQPGDLIVYRMRDNSNGHVMMYRGDGILVHATAQNGGDYQYSGESAGTDITEASGAIGEMNIKTLLDYTNTSRYLMGQLKFGVLRPLDGLSAADITDDAYCRTAFMQGIIAQAVTDLPLSYTVQPGDTITYTLSFENRDTVQRKVHLDIEGADALTLTQPVQETELVMEAGQTASASFTVTVASGAEDGQELEGPVVKANGMRVSTNGYTVGQNLTAQQISALEAVDVTAAGLGDDLSVVRYAYDKAMGWEFPAASVEEVLWSVFYRDDYNNLTVTPRTDTLLSRMLVRRVYGGISVKYDEVSYGRAATYVTVGDFKTGDILLLSSGLTAQTTQLYLCTAPGSFARYYPEYGQVSVLRAGYMKEISESLLSSTCFALLRPSLVMGREAELSEQRPELPVRSAGSDTVITVSQLYYEDPQTIDVYSVVTGETYRVAVADADCLASGRLYRMDFAGGRAVFTDPAVGGMFDGGRQADVMNAAAMSCTGENLDWRTDSGQGTLRLTADTVITQVSNKDYRSNLREVARADTVALSASAQGQTIESNILYCADADGNVKWIVAEKDGLGIGGAVGYPQAIYVQ